LELVALNVAATPGAGDAGLTEMTGALGCVEAGAGAGALLPPPPQDIKAIDAALIAITRVRPDPKRETIVMYDSTGCM
jgi:hypothetical protein